MKIRFYCDVYPYYSPDYQLFATTKQASFIADGATRIAFDVDFPPGLLKEHDVVAPAIVVGEVKP